MSFALQFLVMLNKYIVRDYSLPFTVVVSEGSEGNKADVFQFRREYRNHRKVIGRVRIRIYRVASCLQTTCTDSVE